MTILKLKSQIDIVEVIRNYTELKGTGSKQHAKENPIREERTSSFFVYQDTQKYFDFGTGESGDIVDFIQQVEKLSMSEAVSFLKEKYLSLLEDKSIYRTLDRIPSKSLKKDNSKLMWILETKSKRFLNELRVDHNNRKRNRYRYFKIEMGQDKEIAALDEPFIKLFEHSYLEVDEGRLEYIFQKFVGYDAYYDCPVIILYDQDGHVVNIVKYRPKKNGEVFMKYLYSKNKDMPDSNYLYPFQFEMERLIFKHGFSYVGEGLKNALIALVFGLPYISIESASRVDSRILEYLQSERMKDKFFLGVFDGDLAGKGAYEKITKTIPMENEFDFSSGLDFADYMKRENT